jgi:hypothetical protein
VLQSKAFRIAAAAPWHGANNQFREHLEVPSFADHITALTAGLRVKINKNSKK